MTNESHKINVICIARQHKLHCSGEDCGVSLILLRMMAEKIGIEFTKKELEIFI